MDLALNQEFNPVFDKVVEIVKPQLSQVEPGHDYLHVCRVLGLARTIMQHYPEADNLVVEAAVLLHDIVDSKFFDGSADDALVLLNGYLELTTLTLSQRQLTIEIIETMSFSKNIGKSQSNYTVEYQIVRDADRLDAIGAIGIARTFSFGGIRNSRFYDLANDGFKDVDVESYKKRSSSTVQHFYDKLLKLKETMLTPEAKIMAESRTEFLYTFLDQLKREISGD